MAPNEHAIVRAGWQVIWFKDGRRIVKDFGTDYTDAEALYFKVKLAKRKGATLRCKNVGFEPPRKFRPYRKRKRGRSRRTGKLVTIEVTVNPMKGLNARGIWWCPYCRQVRKFKLSKGYRVEGIQVDETRMVCPVCDISHRNYLVRKHNPIADRVMMGLQMKRGTSKSAQRRRARVARRKKEAADG